MKNKLLAMVLLASASAFGAVSFGIHIGPPPPPRVYAAPPSPGPGYVWVDGYWYPVNGHYRWHEGYWTRPPFAGALWVGPHHDGHDYFEGYWRRPDGERFEHRHEWDRERNRDWDRDGDHDRDHDRH
ncbi:MAG TPA: YXWGXW repeat-containing protein [Bryobacteraceae bacterium]|nr:YXWGXW repeat-containing protein [Bryobacteraceae bacterium]